jgi:hypothetical protein
LKLVGRVQFLDWSFPLLKARRSSTFGPVDVHFPVQN